MPPTDGPNADPPASDDALVDAPPIDGSPVAGPDATAHEDPFAELAGDNTDDLLRQWTDEDHHESDAPRRNWMPVVVALAIIALGASVFGGARVLIDRSGDEPAAAGARGEDARVGSVLEKDPPSLEDLISDVTLPPGPDEPLAVLETGVTIVQDRFDDAKREGTFAVIVENPHDDWLAQGVQLQIDLLSADGRVLAQDTGFIELVLPGQRVAVASLFFDAPSEDVVELDVTLDVARWRQTEPIGELFEYRDVVTGEAEFSGVETSFVLAVDSDRPLTDVGVTAVYRDAAGAIIGGYDTFIDEIRPDEPVAAEISLLANVDPERVASTELFATAAFGFIPDR